MEKVVTELGPRLAVHPELWPIALAGAAIYGIYKLVTKD